MPHQVEPDRRRGFPLQLVEEQAAALLAEPPSAVLHLPERRHSQGGEYATNVEAAEADLVPGVPDDAVGVEWFPVGARVCPWTAVAEAGLTVQHGVSISDLAGNHGRVGIHQGYRQDHPQGTTGGRRIGDGGGVLVH
jgi:hypothetical protein